MTELVVATPHLKELTDKQATASKALGTAAGAADGIGERVWISHGVACGMANYAVQLAEDARRAACKALQKASTDLAHKLYTAANTYDRTDQHASDNLDNQMRAG
ncbi:ESX-1 secretion-associated protein [Mycobacterium sp. 050134]|uniref:ESX-1 secretion-associated protein n=1 Tax=Mycobacterium sp. 050134 TaxID=3096111 RepID=UPI002EDA4298